jgi:hypothetical protein
MFSRTVFEKQGDLSNKVGSLNSAAIHRSAQKKNSTKFTNKVSNITHLGDAPTPLEGYVANVAWGGPPREGQDRYLPSF